MFAGGQVGAFGDGDLAVRLGADGAGFAGGAEAADEDADAGGDHGVVEFVDSAAHGFVFEGAVYWPTTISRICSNVENC